MNTSGNLAGCCAKVTINQSSDNEQKTTKGKHSLIFAVYTFHPSCDLKVDEPTVC